MPNFKLIAEGLNVQPLLDKLADHPDLWGQITDRQNYPGSAHKDTETIYLRWARDQSVMGGFFDLTCEDHAETIRALDPVVSQLVCQALDLITPGRIPDVGRVILTRLKPGGSITPHVDEGPYADRYDRFHLCVQADWESAGLGIYDGAHCVESIHAKPGTLFWFNHKKMHGAWNVDEAPRIHLIIELIAPEYRAMRGLTFQRERAHELLDEAKPLYEAHYKEIAFYKDIPLVVNEAAYIQAEESNQLRCYTARYNGDLVGYCVFRVCYNPRYSTSLQANQDILYVDKSKRGALIGKRLVEYCHERLKAEGVQLTMQHCKVPQEIKDMLADMKDRKDVGKLFELLGYDLIDFVYAKRLDR